MTIVQLKQAVALAVLLAGVAATPVQAGGWIADASAGCQVWNPHPQPYETIRWSGACPNGFAHGRGAAQWFKNNLPFETDEGEWLSGRQTGYGTQVWPSGRYDGDLVDGEPQWPRRVDRARRAVRRRVPQRQAQRRWHSDQGRRNLPRHLDRGMLSRGNP
jgi:hypothetical protein